MNRINIKIKKLRHGAVLPAYGSQAAAGADLYACLDEAADIPPGAVVMIPTGLCLELPEGFAGFVYARSGLASKHGLAPANKVGVIDSDYRGELIVALYNHGALPVRVEARERIAQLVIAPVFTARFLESDTLSDTARADGGFGSTGTL